mmetsp:Transcript_102080/g.284186  ORF Transcript_102080/g.284186 Transcript_102080/m.284186 type:complete len:240 (-) Transcript_102080:158-877(-)|eukprot:CAMPEP_0179107308 /NCGR_PEP_ID=MMETSP0796-20121207/49938_1 /TAXON_ID=73915 /ORGANISM="Pyrodinium bahamense, Strain pbaha01" /LENGTH=239 /DNA_ID=CAMNT_0020805365 /DNA_START=140 /DNA_END=859 /DNA_ORIENTATION=+
MTAAASALAQVLSAHDDSTVQQAVLLLISQRPALQTSLLTVLQEPPGRRYSGTIKSFWPEKHFGFIACEEVREQFNADVFLSDQEIGYFTVGSAVTFSIVLNKDGRPQAKLLEAADGTGGPGRPMAAIQPPRKVPRLQPPPPQPQPQPWPQYADTEAPPAAGPGAEERQVGTIKSFWPEKHYGFIACDELRATHGGDVFLSDQELNGFGVGDWVSFTVAFNKNGRPQAHQLQPVQQELA